MLKKRLGIEAIERNWSVSNNVNNYFKISSTLTIPESVERIGSCAFNHCSSLKRVEIPGSVKELGECAFCSCYRSTIIFKKPVSEFKIGLDSFCGVWDVKEEIRP